jgi:hypothetical protein
MSDYLYNLPNNTSGLDNLLIETITLFPALPSLMLTFVFLTVFIGGVTRQKIRTGTADYPAWAVLGSISIFILALLLSVNTGFIGLDVLVIVTCLTIGSGVWLFMDRRASEV